ncbi:hypothetical protein IEC97_10960 [Neobacillus cucumis]|uniref:CBO0543 family protein n=1 Tax=Neobacillus cucumis TaxID=1740721 RepID=UPI0018E0543B|nr:CBO0543 family protein [Neobacillus cucumis]MBI0577884.1 hypothetical protein [Neobacillus cucumis]
MSKEKRIIITSLMVSFLLLLCLTPKRKIRQATLILLFQQSYAWITGLFVVEKGWIAYPKRLFFKKSYKGSFTFEHFVFPIVSVLFNLYYPVQKKSGFKALYYLFYCSVLCTLEVIGVKYTRVITYKKWHWYFSFSSMWISFYVSRAFYRWFFKYGIVKDEK